MVVYAAFLLFVTLFSSHGWGATNEKSSVITEVGKDVKQGVESLIDWDLRHAIDYNISNGTCFYDAKAGFNAIGPSGYIRTRVSDIHPIHVSLPSLDIGCGGIDYSFGAINIASGSELVDAMKNIGINAATHAFLLAVVTISPEVKDVITTVQHWANQLNAININSCEIGSSLVESVWPALENSKQYICSNLASKHNQFRDRISARHGCSGYKGKLEETLAQKGMQEAKTYDLLEVDPTRRTAFKDFLS